MSRDCRTNLNENKLHSRESRETPSRMSRDCRETVAPQSRDIFSKLDRNSRICRKNVYSCDCNVEVVFLSDLFNKRPNAVICRILAEIVGMKTNVTLQLLFECLFLTDISCLTRDRFVHHTLKYKRVLMGMSQNKIPIFYTSVSSR